jgi:NADPH-dependent glutamate synthase beta subunit-like oxidoreductase/CO/xanthine dehydrogenase FAD-binding subunit
MRIGEYHNVTAPSEATALLAEAQGKARVVAGGTDLFGILKDEVRNDRPEVLVNLKTLVGADYIVEDEAGLRIGALARLHDIQTSETVKAKFPLLAQAAHSVATPQIRNVATIAGNICQEPRCWYYRYPDDTFHCLRKGGELCNALTGENQYHSIFGSAKVGSTPCTVACPADTDVPLYFSLLRAGEVDEAARALLSANPIPAITGRVCPHYCLMECNRDSFDEPVSIQAVERALGDYVLANFEAVLPPPAPPSGKKMAVVGSGPAGLAAAHYLALAGHQVTVFERSKEPGGMLAYAIPTYRLPRDVLRRSVGVLEHLGVSFRLNVEIGRDITLADLRAGHDGLFLATGAWGQPAIGLEGEELTTGGLEFLTKVSLGDREVPGERVLVIGGGNVAVDVAITALRLGAREVTMACLECREEMPALEHELEQAAEEKVTFLPSWGPARVLTRDGKVLGMELRRCTSVFDGECRFSPTFDESTTLTIEADRIFLAVGQRAELDFVGPDGGPKVDRGLIAVDAASQLTSLTGIYAGGDAVTGPSTVVAAIAAGRRAAAALGSSLAEESPPEGSNGDWARRGLLDFDPSCLLHSDQMKAPRRALAERTVEAEDVTTVDFAHALAEVSRCFNCGCLAVTPSDLAPALIALDAVIITTKRSIPAQGFFAAGRARSTVLDPDEVVTEIRVPASSSGGYQAYTKFRIRQSIDFPMVGVATWMRLTGATVEDARIVLGAVAPIPVRATEAEEFLKGRETTQDAAASAGALAVEGVRPLVKNGYKAQIVRTLVKRAVLAAGQAESD